MKLAKKTYIYTLIFAIIVSLSFILYMMFLLPSLYVNHIKARNLRNVEEIQEIYSRDKSYKNINPYSVSSTASMIIDKSSYNIDFASKFFKGSILIKDQKIKDILDRSKDFIENKGDAKFEAMEGSNFSAIPDLFKSMIQIDENEFFDFKFEYDKSAWTDAFKVESPNVKIISDNEVIIENTAENKELAYTTYLGVKNTDKEIYLTFMSVVSPSLNEIIPVTLSSIPMIVIIIFLIVFLASFIFSRNIVQPIVKLSNHALHLSSSGGKKISRFSYKVDDEISQLGEILDNLYIDLMDNYEKLELENKRQEVFVRASSHQLKTPVAAAKLLIDGMINEVGRYKDTKKYLPELRNKLVNIEKIIKDLLLINNLSENIIKEPVSIKTIIDEVLETYSIYIKEKNLKIDIHDDMSLIIDTDRQIFKKILDNIISNAIEFSPPEKLIKIDVDGAFIRVRNEGVSIAPNIINHIFDPFVSTKGSEDGNGLGLYIVAYYANILDYSVDIKNDDGGVLVTIKL